MDVNFVFLFYFFSPPPSLPFLVAYFKGTMKKLFCMYVHVVHVIYFSHFEFKYSRLLSFQNLMNLLKKR